MKPGEGGPRRSKYFLFQQREELRYICSHKNRLKYWKDAEVPELVLEHQIQSREHLSKDATWFSKRHCRERKLCWLIKSLINEQNQVSSFPAGGPRASPAPSSSTFCNDGNVFFLCPFQYGSHQRHVAVPLLNCHKCHWGAEVLILLNINSYLVKELRSASSHVLGRRAYTIYIYKVSPKRDVTQAACPHLAGPWSCVFKGLKFLTKPFRKD